MTDFSCACVDTVAQNMITKRAFNFSPKENKRAADDRKSWGDWAYEIPMVTEPGISSTLSTWWRSDENEIENIWLLDPNLVHDQQPGFL
jgi:hypothetical protein